MTLNKYLSLVFLITVSNVSVFVTVLRCVFKENANPSGGLNLSLFDLLCITYLIIWSCTVCYMLHQSHSFFLCVGLSVTNFCKNDLCSFGTVYISLFLSGKLVLCHVLFGNSFHLRPFSLQPSFLHVAQAEFSSLCLCCASVLLSCFVC